MIFTFKIQCSYCGLLRSAEDMVGSGDLDHDVFVAHTGLICPDDEAGDCIDRHEKAWDEKLADAPIV